MFDFPTNSGFLAPDLLDGLLFHCIYWHSLKFSLPVRASRRFLRVSSFVSFSQGGMKRQFSSVFSASN